MGDARGHKRPSTSWLGFDTRFHRWPNLVQRPLQKVLELRGGVELVFNALLCEKGGQLVAHTLWLTGLTLNLICRAPIILCLIDLQCFALPRNHFANILESTQGHKLAHLYPPACCSPPVSNGQRAEMHPAKAR